MNKPPEVCNPEVAPRKAETRVSASRYFPVRCGLGAAALLLMAVALRWGAAPAFERLPAAYSAETGYSAKLTSRQTPTSPAEECESIVRRHEQTLTCGEKQSVIQGDMQWSTTAGVMIFETLNTYGVDRNGRQNLAEYGNEKREGQYLFPPHTAKQPYKLWDPVYAGPRSATFDHVAKFHGVEVFVFKTLADGVDETAGFVSLPGFPDKYHGLSYGNGRYWIEPVSGFAVNHEDSGTSYFVDAKTGERVGGPIAQWSQRFTPETIQAQVRLANATRRWICALELWLPLASGAAGLIVGAAGIRAWRESDG